ncbi:type VI secretion system tip protein VgrG [uncultured Roseobacter sp.]|uniref:type VI secretion system tip protein VgrG n=1 Tax=uncultured Roseobacter sp. TaxID=114847 RepID=UPI002629F80B|nr:type VI secretion system tip protein VgrG [uncultured Roseobacter sp.]
MADSPTANADGPVGVTIKVDGTAIADSLMVASVKVFKKIGRIPEAVVTIETGSIATNEFDAIDSTGFDLGKEIEISAYYGSGTPGEIFKGVIYGKRMRIRNPHPPRMILTCRDKAAALNVIEKTAQFMAQKDSDAMSQIISDAGLTADVSATSTSARDQLQNNTTDWDFLRALADRNGFILLAEAGTVTAKEPDDSGSAVLTLTLGVDIIDFDVAADTGHLLGAASGTSWDDSAQETVSKDGDALPTQNWGNLTSTALADVIGAQEHHFAVPDIIDAADIGVMASARTLRSSLSALQGRCSFIGSALPLPDTVLELTGVGDRFGGKAYVSAVENTIEDGEWRTEVTLGLPGDWRSDTSDLGGADAAGLTTPIHGLQIGKVVKITEDPDSRLRVQINLPMFGEKDTLVWARYAAPYSTADAGIQFMPEVDDEVVVAFLNADPNAPVILGSLHNGSNAQPYAPDEPNTYKAIVSKSLIKIEFEDAKKILTLETPGGHSVVLDDEAQTITITDSNGNSMEMASAGITLDSPGDITLKATGNIALQATGDATVEGMNVSLTANTQLTASGNAGAELSASGQTVVKGAIVMIN